MKFDIVLCTYNGEKYIEQQLYSIIEQKYNPTCIYIGDDGSSDSTLEKVETLLKKHQITFKITKNTQRLGYANNFITQLMLCRSDIIFFADQDDIWHKNKVSVVEKYIKNQKNKECMLFFSDAYITDEKLNKKPYTLWNLLKVPKKKILYYSDDISNRFFVTGATMIIRRNLIQIECIKNIPINIPHDAWISSIASFNGGLATINEKLIYYRQHSQNQLGAKKKQIKESLKEIINKRKFSYRINVIENRISLMKALATCPNAPIENLSRQITFYENLRNALIQSKRPRFNLIHLYFRYKSQGIGLKIFLLDILI